ncbi:putative intracellular septation protein [Trichinella spiralis]|uniref:putative intracellular septation protein n=1 Tax=Trichinella spiralis TaxID=6334 RepID=UPI0001EFE9D6|nr:putative intracellular septation protein [Trichinella spiralis]
MAVSFILIKIISPERCSSLVFSINYKWQIVFIANQFVSVMKMFRKPVSVSASAFSIIKNFLSFFFCFTASERSYITLSSHPHFCVL